MTLEHSSEAVSAFREVIRQMPQKRISICTPLSVGSLRGMVVDASGDVALAAELALVLYVRFGAAGLNTGVFSDPN